MDFYLSSWKQILSIPDERQYAMGALVPFCGSFRKVL